MRINKWFWIVPIYLLGCFTAYRITKYNEIEFNKSIHICEYSIGDRSFTLFLSSFSWASVVVGVIIHFMQAPINDQPANW